MKKSLFSWQMAGFIFTGILGVLLHFLFDWTGGMIVVAPFSAVNESIFEHMKLLLFPMFFFALVETRYIREEYNNFWWVKLIGIALGVILIPVMYYTINGAFGSTRDWVNIAIFFVTAAISYLVQTRLFDIDSISCKSSRTALLILLLIAFAFVVLTFAPLRIPLFEDPITKTYGYIK